MKSTSITSPSLLEVLLRTYTECRVGCLLLFGGGGLLIWNERRSSRRQADLDEARGMVQELGMVTIDDAINKWRDNALVYVTGLVDAGNDVIFDELFNLDVTSASKAIKYKRSVEAFQWEERSETKTKKKKKKRKSDGSTRTREVTSYFYYQQWSSRLIRSSNFEERVTPPNPTSFLVNNYTKKSNDVWLGPFRVSTGIASQVNWETIWTDAPIDPSGPNFPRFPGYVATFSQGVLHLQKDRYLNSIGDNMVTFSVVLPDYVSVVAKQGSTGMLEPYITKEGRKLLLFSRGIKTSNELFDSAEKDNVVLAWVLRFTGLLTFTVGVLMMQS